MPTKNDLDQAHALLTTATEHLEEVIATVWDTVLGQKSQLEEALDGLDQDDDHSTIVSAVSSKATEFHNATNALHSLDAILSGETARQAAAQVKRQERWQSLERDTSDRPWHPTVHLNELLGAGDSVSVTKAILITAAFTRQQCIAGSKWRKTLAKMRPYLPLLQKHKLGPMGMLMLVNRAHLGAKKAA